MDIRLAPSRTPGISPTDIAGEKMARINPMTGFAATAETQTGGWFENQLEQKLRSKIEEKSVQTTDSEDALPKRKLRRRDTMSYSNVATASRPSETQDPVIDKYTHLLGIGWAKLGDDPHVLAAARGWST